MTPQRVTQSVGAGVAWAGRSAGRRQQLKVHRRGAGLQTAALTVSRRQGGVGRVRLRRGRRQQQQQPLPLT